MKKWMSMVLIAVMLSGCTEPKSFETMADVYAEKMGNALQISLALPEEAAAMAMTGQDGASIYLCDGYSITVQTLLGGDLDATIRAVSGYAREKLQIQKREDGDYKRYECVWAAAGEGEDQIGRAVILDDGSYHYTLTVMAGASEVGELTETWQALTDSFGIVP